MKRQPMFRKTMAALSAAVILSIMSVSAQQSLDAMGFVPAQLAETVNGLTWTGQSSVRWMAGSQAIHIDPFNITFDLPAHLVFITHTHGDHLSVADLKRVVGSHTRIIATPDCEASLRDNGFTLYRAVAPGDTFTIDGIAVTVVPAYTITKSTHPKENNWVGYVITAGNVTIYHPGDTQRLPDMKNIRCDIAFMPLGQKYTMDKVEDAVDAILDICPTVAIPFHFGMYEGTADDALTFQRLLSEKEQAVVILPKK
ncbi:MAG: MBL fold metallo-hydrolase [Marinilabiliaceae bacterium]|nr:MBL fold metallo-hydrolase [Marinilabiliaceae bacterium]